jgi:toxin-antitoxin system PIN domain toxin
LLETVLLPDVNVLVALMDENHAHHAIAERWFDGLLGKSWAMCPLTGSAFMRLMTHPRIGALRVEQAVEQLKSLAERPGYRFWPISDDWVTLCGPFMGRIFGHQQIADAYLLGLAVREGGVLVTMDKGLQFLAEARYRAYVLVLE